MRLTTAAAAVILLATQASVVRADDIVRHKIPNSSFPISLAVEVPAGKTTVYLSGVVPSVADEKADKNSVAAYGDTTAQTVSVFKSINTTLESLHLKMSDVIKMQVFLVGDPAKGGKMDFAGFMAGYTQFFGTAAQPNLPSRSVVQVAGLANPGFLVEIEVVAIRP